MARIEEAVPGLAKALDKVHASLLKHVVHKADKKLTAVEAAELTAAIRGMSGDYATAIYDAQRLLVEAGWENARELLDITIWFDVVPVAQIDALRDNAEAFGKLVLEREKKALLEVIEQALGEGWTANKTAAALRDTFNDGYHIYADGKLEAVVPTQTWSQMVARTELSRAQTMGNMALYRSAKIKTVLYATTEGPNVCSICEPCDGQIYPVDNAPEIPQHPRCCCAYLPADIDVNPAAHSKE